MDHLHPLEHPPKDRVLTVEEGRRSEGDLIQVTISVKVKKKLKRGDLTKNWEPEGKVSRGGAGNAEVNDASMLKDRQSHRCSNRFHIEWSLTVGIWTAEGRQHSGRNQKTT